MELNAASGEELSIEADQNLQKFVFSDSDATTLRLYLDSYDDNSYDPLQRDSTKSNNHTNATAITLESGPDAQNYIRSSDKIKVFVKTSGSFVRISKRNFGVVNIYARLNRDPFDQTQRNLFSKFNCNGHVLFNNVFVEDADLERRNLSLSTRDHNQNVFAYLCSESFDLRIGENDKLVEFSAFKTN